MPNSRDKIGLKTFALAGNSMGGGVAARFAEEHPDRVTALILVDAAGMPTKGGDRIPIAFQLLRQDWAKPILAYLDPGPLVREGLNDAIVRKAIITDAMLAQYRDFAIMEGSRDATQERFSQFGAADMGYVKDHVGALKIPVLILWGEEDHLIPGRGGAWLERRDSRVEADRLSGHRTYPDGGGADRSAADGPGFPERRSSLICDFSCAVKAVLTGHGYNLYV